MKLQIEYGQDIYDVDVEVLPTDRVAPASGYVPPLPRRPGSQVGRKRGGQEEDDHICRSPLRGIVARVNVQPGQRVEAGEVVMVLEAMKMETNISAPRMATVKAVHVTPGAGVQVGTILIEYD